MAGQTPNLEQQAGFLRHTLKEERVMSGIEPWQVSEDAAVIYEQKFVPALFGNWPPSVADATGIRLGDDVKSGDST